MISITGRRPGVTVRGSVASPSASQAALGLIGPILPGIAVEPRPNAIVLHFAITARTAEVEEDIDDIVFELKAFLGGGPEQHSEITTEVHVGGTVATWPGRQHALLYLAKPEAG
ncbi:hypothetical protein ACFYYB_33370 [Streptomyces sp. NPDC002886]|uniref:hypothetical protein n=1 Tax=Streptomyces sp. NPDC002886 TaxID=3364667 RepID=UPI0036ABA6AB